MPAHIVDLTRRRYGRLRVLRLYGRVRRKDNCGTILYWLCRCRCGREKAIQGSDLKSERVTSCGCLARELLRTQNRKRACRKKETS